MTTRLLIPFFIFWPLLLPQFAVADQQNPLLTPNSIILSQQGVHKFDRQTLKPQWQSLQGVQTYHPVRGEQLLYVGSTQGLFALNPENGDIVWQIESDKTVFSPTVSDRIYAGSLHGELYAINPEDGSIDWRKQFEGWIYSPVAEPHKKQLWIAGQSHQARFLDIDSGKLLGKVELGQEALFSPQQIDDDHIAINLFNGTSAIVNLTTAQLSGQLEGRSQPRHLSVNANTIYRSSRDGSLTAFDTGSHKSVWQQDFVSSDLSMHPAKPGYLLMSDLDRKLLLIDLTHRDVVYKTSIDGQWFSPVQIDPEAIVYFIKNSMQPNQIHAVKISARGT